MLNDLRSNGSHKHSYMQKTRRWRAIQLLEITEKSVKFYKLKYQKWITPFHIFYFMYLSVPYPLKQIENIKVNRKLPWKPLQGILTRTNINVLPCISRFAITFKCDQLQNYGLKIIKRIKHLLSYDWGWSSGWLFQSLK